MAVYHLCLVPMKVRRSEKGTGFLTTGVLYGCELPSGYYWTEVLCRNKYSQLLTHLSICLSPVFFFFYCCDKTPWLLSQLAREKHVIWLMVSESITFQLSLRQNLRTRATAASFFAKISQKCSLTQLLWLFASRTSWAGPPHTVCRALSSILFQDPTRMSH